MKTIAEFLEQFAQHESQEKVLTIAEQVGLHFDIGEAYTAEKEYAKTAQHLMSALELLDSMENVKAQTAKAYYELACAFYRNAEYDAAKEAQGLLELKINQLDDFPILVCDFEPNSLTYIPYNSYFKENYKTNKETKFFSNNKKKITKQK